MSDVIQNPEPVPPPTEIKPPESTDEREKLDLKYRELCMQYGHNQAVHQEMIEKFEKANRELLSQMTDLRKEGKKFITQQSVIPIKKENA